jgi:hypothetical protein
MIFEEATSLELMLVINEQIRPLQIPKKPMRKVQPTNKYEAQIEVTLVINKDFVNDSCEQKDINISNTQQAERI